jgi:ABC-2 type transport system permease protein
MQNLKHTWFIAMKNLRLFMTDRTALIMFILFPFLFIVGFNLMMNNAIKVDERLTLNLATQESEGISLQIIQALETKDPTSLSPGSPIVIWEKDYAKARTDVENKKISGFLVFPADFTQKVMAGAGTEIDIVAQPDATNTRMALQGLADSLASIMNAHRTELHTAAGVLTQLGQSQAEIQKAVAQITTRQMNMAGNVTLINSRVEKMGEVKSYSASSFTVPGYLVMFVFFAAAIASIDIIQERRNHTLERLLASSVKKESILGGIYLGGVLRGLVQIIIFWTMGILVFKIDLGVAPWAVFLLSFLMVLMAAAFSVMLATLVKTERSASALAVLCALILAPLGGCWWPLFVVPNWMQFMARVTPHGWANIGFNNLMLFGAKGWDVASSMLALLIFTVAFLLIAIARFRTGAEAT